MIKAFFDSSVLVAASISKTGGSSYLLGLCRQKKIKGLISWDVIGEARKNINLKLGLKEKQRFIFYLKNANLKLVSEPSVEEISVCEKIIFPKDASILAAAKKSKADYLVTLDKKHFFQPKVINFAKPLKIITPKDLIKILKQGPSKA